MKTLFKDVKGPEGSGSKAADEQTASVQAPQKNKLFDWVNVDFGFLHSKIIKKMFGSLGDNYSTGKSGNNERFPSLSHPRFRPGIFFLVSLILCLISLSSDLSLYILLFKTGFFWSHGIVLLGSKVGGDNRYSILINQ